MELQGEKVLKTHNMSADSTIESPVIQLERFFKLLLDNKYEQCNNFQAFFDTINLLDAAHSPTLQQQLEN